jgi:hypothetical protein
MGAGADYRALAKRYRNLPEQMVRAGAAEMQKAVTIRLKRDTGGDQRMSGFTRRPGRHARMTVTAKISPGTRIATATIEASPRKFRGMWAILEGGTAERIVGQLKRKNKAVGPGGKHMNSAAGDAEGWKTGPWSAGHSPAKHTFTYGVHDGATDAQRAMDDVWERVT